MRPGVGAARDGVQTVQRAGGRADGHQYLHSADPGVRHLLRVRARVLRMSWWEWALAVAAAWALFIVLFVWCWSRLPW